MKTINANGTPTARMGLSSPKKQNRNTGAIVGGTMVGVAAIFAVIGVVIFVQRRRGWRRSRPRSILSTDFVDPGPQMVVSYDHLMAPAFGLNSFDANQDSRIPTGQQPLEIGEPEAEVVAPHGPSSSSRAVLPVLRQVTPVPAGLSDKELARLRAATLSSPQRLNFRISTLYMSQPMSPPNASIESGDSTLDTRRLHSEFESLRQEVVRLREEGLVVGAPPSYAEGDV